MLKLKKSKYIFAAVLSLLLLGGCGKKSPDASDGTEQTAPDTSVTSAETTVPVSEATAAETAKTEPTTSAVNPEAEKTVLMRLVQTAASEGEERTFDITDELFGDFDGDGRYELIAGCAGYYWYTDGKKTEILKDEFWGMNLDKIDVGGQTVITMSVENGKHTYLYIMKNGEFAELEASGKFGKITASGNGIFTAVSHDYDNCVGIDREHTWKPYWLYFEDGEFKEYVGERITKADFMKYTGGKAALDGIEADGAVTDILYRENGIVNINYTVTKDGGVFNKFKIYDVSGGDCKEIKAIFEGRENDYGIYLPSALSPYGEEQLALHRLIEMTSGGNPWDDVIDPLFGDFDGDGKNELIAEYGSRSKSELWFASGGRAYKLEERANQKSIPCIIKFAGNTYFMVQHYRAGTLGGITGDCYYYLIKNSIASEVGGTNDQDLLPDSDYGDLISEKMMYDSSFSNEMSMMTGATGKKFWYYLLNGEIHEYYGKEITREEFLKYDGAAGILEEIAADGKEVKNILKRGNGIININYLQEDEYGINFNHITVKYRNGKVFKSEEYSKQGGNYENREYPRTEQTDFEHLCEMIYDSSEGSDQSRIRERFYGDVDGDGKNELYAYYGSDEGYSFRFADENGVKPVDGRYTQILLLDGEYVLKQARSETERDISDFYIIRDGKSKRIDCFGAKALEQSANGDFTGIITAEDAYSDDTVKTEKEYWFYFRDGEFHDYTAKEITEEQLADYKGARAALDEITSMGGEVVSILQRDNGIININYDSHMQELTMHCYLTLKIDGKGRAENITPKNGDGTLNNKGFYLHSLKAGN